MIKDLNGMIIIIILKFIVDIMNIYSVSFNEKKFKWR